VDKILFTATESQLHIEAFHLPYLKWFKEHGYEVHVATRREKDIPYCDVLHDISFRRSPFRPENIQAYYKLKSIIDSNNYKLIHCHTPMGGVITRFSASRARNKGTKILYTAHGFHFFKGAPLINWFLYYPVEKWLSKYTDCIITINEEDYGYAKSKGFKSKDVRLIDGVGVDLHKFNPIKDEDKKALREKYGYRQDDFILIYVGELIYRKHQDYFFDIMDLMKNKIPRLRLLLVGNGSLMRSYADTVKKRDLDQYISFLGYRKDVPALMALSDVAVSSSRQEGLPVNIMEAMATGLPLVVSNCRGNRDLVRHHVNGFIFDLDDPEEFSSDIEQLFESEELRKKISANSLKIVARYSLPVVLKEMEKIYEEYL
jgi:glycosyltransferase EpsD